MLRLLAPVALGAGLLSLCGCLSTPYPEFNTPAWQGRCGGVPASELAEYRASAHDRVIQRSPGSERRFLRQEAKLSECPRDLADYYRRVAGL